MAPRLVQPLASMPPLLMTVAIGAGDILCSWAPGTPPPQRMMGWADAAPALQIGVMIAGAVVVLPVRWWRGRLLRKFRAEGVKLADPETPTPPKSEA